MVSMRKVWMIAAGLFGSLTMLNSSAANVSITDEFVRAVPAVSDNSAGFMTLQNRDDEPVRLESVDSDLAARTEIHGHTMKDGLMKMYKVTGGIELPPGQTVKLASGGYHIMLMGLKTELKEGDTVGLTLHFSDGDAVDLVVPVKALQPTSQTPQMQLNNGRVRATAPGMSTSAAYFTIHNGGQTTVQLTGIESPVARKSELHTTVMKSGMMRMQEVEALDIPAGGEVELKPGGYHVMLMGLKKAIEPGDHVPVTLSFSNGDTVTVHAMAMKEIKGQGMAH